MPAFLPPLAPALLARHGFDPAKAAFSELGGGISNTVILAETPDRRAIFKQSQGKLRVAQEWLSDRERVFREADAMRWLQGKTRGGRVPRILGEDRESFCLVMEAAPAGLEMWKTRLFEGVFDPACARAAGTLLGSLIASSWNHPEAERIFRDQTVFDQLRIDPYYRSTARRRPEVAGYIDALVARSSRRRVSLVHGDWSPKNLLVGGGELWAIDWEVVHFGDPSYDAAFLVNHLLLKSIAMPGHRDALAGLAVVFLQALRAELPADAGWLEGAAMEHLPALLLARVAGKSPAEYLDAAMREVAWERGLDLVARPARTVEEVWNR